MVAEAGTFFTSLDSAKTNDAADLEAEAGARGLKEAEAGLKEVNARIAGFTTQIAAVQAESDAT